MLRRYVADIASDHLFLGQGLLAVLLHAVVVIVMYHDATAVVPELRRRHRRSLQVPDEINLSNPAMTKQWYETISFTIKDSKGRDQVVHTQPMVLYAAVLKNAQDGVEQGKSSYRLCKAPRGRNCSKRLATPNLKETAYMPAKKTGLGGGMVIPAFYPAVKYPLIVTARNRNPSDSQSAHI